MGIIEENYSELANAIVLQACKDYKDALKDVTYMNATILRGSLNLNILWI